MEDPKKQTDAAEPAYVEEQAAGLTVEGQPLSEDELKPVSGGLASSGDTPEVVTCIF